MNLLIYTGPFAPSIGGIETYVMLLATGLAQQQSSAESEPARVTVVTATPAGKFQDASLPFRLVRRPGILTLVRLVRRADVIHLAGPAMLPMILGMVFRKIVVVEHSGYQAICPNGLLLQGSEKAACPGHFLAGRFHKCLRCNAQTWGWTRSFTKLFLTFIRRALLNHVDRNVGPSAHVIDRISLPRTTTIYHGVAKPPVDGSPLPTNTLDPRRFTYVGRLIKEKGVEILLRAAAELASRAYLFRLEIIGEGPDRGRLQELAKTLGVQEQTCFRGALTAEALREAQQQRSIVVMPSICEEVAPLSAIEQMMRGRLLIASDIAGLGEYVDGAGLKFVPGDPVALSDCMKRALNEPDLPNSLGEKARRRAFELFTAENMVSRHVKLYRECLHV